MLATEPIAFPASPQLQSAQSQQLCLDQVHQHRDDVFGYTPTSYGSESKQLGVAIKTEKWADVRPEESWLVQRVWPGKVFSSKRSREVAMD